MLFFFAQPIAVIYKHHCDFIGLLISNIFHLLTSALRIKEEQQDWGTIGLKWWNLQFSVYMHGFRFFFSQRKATLAELNNEALKQVLVKAWGIVWRGYPLCIVLHGLFQQLALLAIVWKRKQLCNLSAILRGEFSGWQTSNLQLHQEVFFVGLKQSR